MHPHRWETAPDSDRDQQARRGPAQATAYDPLACSHRSELVRDGLVRLRDALAVSSDPEDLRIALSQAGGGSAFGGRRAVRTR